MDIEAKALCQVVHELCPRGDAVTVEMRTGRLLWRQFNTCRGGGGEQSAIDSLYGLKVLQICAQPPVLYNITCIPSGCT